jgi:coenzyme F420-reducing hydrogenase delta subunit
MDTVEVLTKARALIDCPERWCRGGLALRDRMGGVLAMCAMGACYYAANETFHDQMDAVSELRKAIGLPKGRAISDWNDAPERTHSEVLAAFDKAIELAKADKKGADK